MSQQFRVNSQTIEDKFNSLLPSQGGQGAGVDLSASTMVIPIVDLTESAQGSDLRQDLQTSFTLTNTNAFLFTNNTSTLLTTTGYYRVIGTSTITGSSTADRINTLNITDGTTTKSFWGHSLVGGGTNGQYVSIPFDYIFKLEAGNSFTITTALNAFMHGSARQIADLQGNLINP